MELNFNILQYDLIVCIYIYIYIHLETVLLANFVKTSQLNMFMVRSWIAIKATSPTKVDQVNAYRNVQAGWWFGNDQIPDRKLVKLVVWNTDFIFPYIYIYIYWE